MSQKAISFDDIETLEADRDEWKQQHENLLAIYQDSLEEAERLREALRKIATYAEPEYREGWKERYHVAMSRIAKHALDGNYFGTLPE